MRSIKNLIRIIPDFPKKGVLFRDITPLLAEGSAFVKVINMFAKETPSGVTKIVGIESRGFIFGGGLASILKIGFVPIRKKEKLPGKTIKIDYDLEYGTDSLEIHQDAIGKGEKVVLIDDLLATGGTASASAKLIEKCGGEVVKMLFLIELEELAGRDKLSNYDIFSVVKD